jgi:hypothetical protein
MRDHSSKVSQTLKLDSAERLCAALAMIIEPGAMVVFRDVLRVDEQTAQQVKG